MRAPLVLALGLALLMVQQLVTTVMALDAWTPDLASVLVLWLGIFRPLGAGVVTTVAGLGLLADGFAGSPLGFNLLHSLALYGLAFGLGNRVRFQGLVGNALLGGAGGVVSVALAAGLARLFFHDTWLADRVSDLFIPRSVGVLGATILLFPVFSRLDELLGRRGETDTLG